MEWVSGNLFIRPMCGAKAGDIVTESHSHNFDHTTSLFKGSLRIEATLRDGTTVVREGKAPSHWLIKANVAHKLTALEDDTVAWCVYSHRSPQGDVVVEYDGWDKAYQ